VLESAREAGYSAVPYCTRAEFVRALLPWLLRYRHVDMIGTGVAQSFISYALSMLLAVRLTQLHVAHGGADDWQSYGRLRRLNRIPVRLIAISEFVRDKLIEHGLRRDRVRVIENFILAEENGVPTRPPFDPSQPGALPVGVRHTRVAVVSRIDPIKRIDLLFEAVARPGLEDLVFDVYGTGAEFDTLRIDRRGIRRSPCTASPPMFLPAWPTPTSCSTCVPRSRSGWSPSRPFSPASS
jgi:glycosyltransferase involved in cell wall biosynthesis